MNGRIYDFLISPLEKCWIDKARAKLLGDLEGTILDLGTGTGANFPHLTGASRVIALDPDPHMLTVAESIAPAGFEIMRGSAENLALPDGHCDHVVSTLVLCSVSQPAQVFEEIKRVLKPGGTFHFLEHVRGDGIWGKLHDWCTPFWSRVAGGCELNRYTLSHLVDAGFEVNEQKVDFTFLGTPFILGRANPKKL